MKILKKLFSCNMDHYVKPENPDPHRHSYLKYLRFPREQCDLGL